jgi:para-nitrobenzyl esterase
MLARRLGPARQNIGRHDGQGTGGSNNKPAYSRERDEMQSKGTSRKDWRRKLVLVSAMLAGVATSAPVWAANDGPVVKTIEGKVRGYTQDGVNIFLGIPYAAPPVGKLRWMPPQPVKKWKGALDATHYGNTCPQVTELGAFAGPASITEDCLYLNVFTTGKGKPNKKKPVIVWIHGGGNVDGESNDYDGSKLATGGPDGVPTVVVTINYRLGLFGFISNPALNAEGHLWGNYGILDVQAVLRWVQRNIAQFGGDPTNVTLGGQSAGARDTTANVLSPIAAGLFHRAILQSYPELNWNTADQILAKGKAFAAAAGCPQDASAKAAKCLRSLSAARILQLQGTPNANSPLASQVFPDGTIIPMQPGEAWQSGRFNRMPIMTGIVRDEGNFGIAISEYFSGPPQAAMTPEQYAAAVTGAKAEQYPLSNYGNNPQIAYGHVTTDPTACTALKAIDLMSGYVPTYGYEFAYQNAPWYFPKMPGFQPLAAHTVDIQFLFPGYHGGNLGVNLDQATGQPRDLNAAETKLSDKLVAAWTHFAKNGNPNGSGNSPWPKYKKNAPKLFSQNIPQSTAYSAAQYSADHRCDFWNAPPTQ